VASKVGKLTNGEAGDSIDRGLILSSLLQERDIFLFKLKDPEEK